MLKYEITDISRVNTDTSIVEVKLSFSKNNLRIVLTVTTTKAIAIEKQVNHYMRDMPKEEVRKYKLVDKEITAGTLKVQIGGYANVDFTYAKVIEKPRSKGGIE